MLRSTLVLLLLCGPAAAAGTIGGPATVVDGDTIEVQGARVHLFGIDAPETAQSCETAAGSAYACGREAARALRQRIGAEPVACERREDAAKGRVSGLCRVRGEDLSAWMVTHGHALATRQVSSQLSPQVSAPYLVQESSAWAMRRGLWAGTFEKPADWRHDRRRMEAAAGASDD